MREAAGPARRAEASVPGDEQHEQLRDAEAAVVADQQRGGAGDVLPAAHLHAEVAPVETVEGPAQDLDQAIVERCVGPVDLTEVAQMVERPEDVDDRRRTPHAAVSPDDLGPGGSRAPGTHV